jgi:ABC-2 type transport system permease protein
VLAGAAVFALYGLAVGLAVRSEAALAAASGSLVILAFMGNIFFPLSGTLLTLAKFTPLYGYVSLARYPLTEGHLFNAAEGTVTHESLWVPVANVVVWAGILALLSVRLVRRGRARQ